MKPSDITLIERLRDGDEQAFVMLVERYHGPLLRFASSFVPSHAVAEEVVQDTWLGVVRGIEHFEGRSSLKTWLFRILANRARSAGHRETRSLPVNSMDEPTVAPERFTTTGQWAEPPEVWAERADDRAVADKLARLARELMERLPPLQCQVILLRDVEGLSAAEACDLLDLTTGNQRVLLHRARARVREELELELGRV